MNGLVVIAVVTFIAIVLSVGHGQSQFNITNSNSSSAVKPPIANITSLRHPNATMTATTTTRSYHAKPTPVNATAVNSSTPLRHNSTIVPGTTKVNATQSQGSPSHANATTVSSGHNTTHVSSPPTHTHPPPNTAIPVDSHHQHTEGILSISVLT